MSQNKCQNDIVKPFGPRALSLLKLERVLKTFSSEKGFSNLLELSLPYTSKHKPPYAQSPIFCLIKKRMKSSTHPILSSPSSNKLSPLTLTMVSKFLLLHTLVILWKNVILLSSSLNQISPDFWLHKVSSIEAHFLYYSHEWPSWVDIWCVYIPAPFLKQTLDLLGWLYMSLLL